ncbi:DUF2161 domain-containing phosphodiesterase [Yoonia sp.]|uniref:DUF2161 domain-containing phosphodiesterase n=1 Tax=Yoonia sp. TaxID=2212373 RepID=UPI003A4DAA69
MPPTPKARLREADLYPPVKAYLQRQGYDVKGEVGAADIAARRGEDLLVVELKLGFSLTLLQQAVERLALTDLVYVAVPAGGRAKALAANVKIARRIGFGVMTVRLRDGFVEVLADPGPYAAKLSKPKRARLLRVFDRLQGDPNAGGATRHGIVTGYRQDALRCARFLAVHGPSQGAKVKQWAEVPQATQIMAADHYGWFCRVARGVYDLTPAGRQGLADFGDDGAV